MVLWQAFGGFVNVDICKVSFFHGNVSALNSLPDAVEGKESLRICLSRDCVCCSASLDYPVAVKKKIPLSISLISNSSFGFLRFSHNFGRISAFQSHCY